MTSLFFTDLAAQEVDCARSRRVSNKCRRRAKAWPSSGSPTSKRSSACSGSCRSRTSCCPKTTRSTCSCRHPRALRWAILLTEWTSTRETWRNTGLIPFEWARGHPVGVEANRTTLVMHQLVMGDLVCLPKKIWTGRFNLTYPNLDDDELFVTKWTETLLGVTFILYHGEPKSVHFFRRYLSIDA